jgi:ABC-type bacteriocin/lantibiotic exporter with double-glycine peptidase domain
VWEQMSTPIGSMSYYRQDTQTTCNVACGMMVLKAAKGIQIDALTLIGEMKKNVDPVRSRLAPDGFTLAQVASALAKPPWRMSLKTHRADAQMIRRVSKERPAIASVEDESFAHAVLIVGNTGNRIVILDPQFECRVIPFDVFPDYPLPKVGRTLRFTETLNCW